MQRSQAMCQSDLGSKHAWKLRLERLAGLHEFLVLVLLHPDQERHVFLGDCLQRLAILQAPADEPVLLAILAMHLEDLVADVAGLK